ALGEASAPEFEAYAAQVVANAKRLADKLMGYGFDLVSGGTDNHLILIDLRNKGLVGKPLAKAMDTAHLVCNYNSVPGDTAGPFNPSGLRLGTPAVTTRGMKEDQMDLIAGWINTISEHLEDEAVISKIGTEVEELCGQFPLPDSFIPPQ
ncbi:MAG: serine hydroxymethyltransferase, partial [Planctomycetota bacterium]